MLFVSGSYATVCFGPYFLEYQSRRPNARRVITTEASCLLKCEMIRLDPSTRGAGGRFIDMCCVREAAPVGLRRMDPSLRVSALYRGIHRSEGSEGVMLEHDCLKVGGFLLFFWSLMMWQCRYEKTACSVWDKCCQADGGKCWANPETLKNNRRGVLFGQ